MAERGVMRLLLPLDGSPLAERAVASAPVLISATTEICLLRGVPVAAPFRHSLISDAHRYLAEVAQGLQAITPGLRVELIVTVGDPGDEILQLVHARRIDLTVMASRTPNPIGRLTLGSVTDDVARRGHGPVVIVRQRDILSQLRRLVVPLDGSHRAERALPVAASVAQRLRLPVHLLTVAAEGGGGGDGRGRRVPCGGGDHLGGRGRGSGLGDQ